MEGLLHLFDFNHGSVVRKLWKHKRDVDGLEAPRNSLELPEGNPLRCFPVGDNVLLSEDSLPDEDSMKKLINEEISKGPNTRRTSPSIVARLMGMDMLPSDSKPIAHSNEKKDENSETNFRTKDIQKSSDEKVSKVPFKSKSFQPSKERDFDGWDSDPGYGKQQRREHPQEAELQKFKKEFEAWQAARLNDYTKDPKFSQENLENFTPPPNTDSRVPPETEKPSRFHNTDSRVPSETHGYVTSEMIARDSDEKLCRSLSPTRIVILKPGPDRLSDHEESCARSSGTVEEQSSIEDFLQEVKERLKCEMQGRSPRRGRGGGIETPFSEKLSDPRVIARHIAKQARENVGMDHGFGLLRSESTRSYRSETPINGSDSPEFINRDTRRLLSERLRNVLKGDSCLNSPIDTTSIMRSSVLDVTRSRIEQAADILRAGNKANYWENMKDESEIQTRSFRHGAHGAHDEVSPRNLIRSLSAPVSGTSFGKLLLEDRHIVTGVQIRRKHESVENVSVHVKKQKERFNFKEKVSNFRYSFTLRGRLFGRKFQFEELHGSGYGNMYNSKKDIRSGPTVVMNFNDRHENSTEVPPSPASVCSSVHEELWRFADHHTAMSMVDAPLVEEDTAPQVFREINSNLAELRRQLNELQSCDSNITAFKKESPDTGTVEIEDQAEAFVRDLLVVSGLYDGSNKSLSRLDPFAKPLSNWVFEKIEESLEKSKSNQGFKIIDHKLLFDLSNEALSTLLKPSIAMLQPPRGRKLLEGVWDIIRLYIHPPVDKAYCSLDVMVGRDLRAHPWTRLMSDDVDALGREIETLIIRDLVDEILSDA